MLELLQGPEDLARFLQEAGMEKVKVDTLLRTKQGTKEAMRWVSGIATGTVNFQDNDSRAQALQALERLYSDLAAGDGDQDTPQLGTKCSRSNMPVDSVPTNNAPSLETTSRWNSYINTYATEGDGTDPMLNTMPFESSLRRPLQEFTSGGGVAGQSQPQTLPAPPNGSSPNGMQAGPEDIARILLELGMDEASVDQLLQDKDGFKGAIRYLLSIGSGASGTATPITTTPNKKVASSGDSSEASSVVGGGSSKAVPATRSEGAEASADTLQDKDRFLVCLHRILREFNNYARLHSKDGGVWNQHIVDTSNTVVSEINDAAIRHVNHGFTLEEGSELLSRWEKLASYVKGLSLAARSIPQTPGATDLGPSERLGRLIGQERPPTENRGPTREQQAGQWYGRGGNNLDHIETLQGEVAGLNKLLREGYVDVQTVPQTPLSRGRWSPPY